MNSLLTTWSYTPVGAGALGLVAAALFFLRVRSLPDGNEAMNRIAGYIRVGAMAFLWREYRVLAVYALVVFAALSLALGPIAGGSFLTGAALSLGAGFVGMRAATLANVRTARAAME